MAKSYIESLLGEHERIVYVARQHWFVLLSSITVELVMLVVIVAIGVALPLIFPVIGSTILLIIPLLLLIVPFLGGLRDTLTWWNRQYIITNRRVMHVSGVFSKNVTDSSLEKVNDVKLEQSAVGRMFNFGDIQILTASELGVANFQRIGEPIRFKTAMINAKEMLEHGEQVNMDLDDIPAMIAR
ncbi:MAG: PH domain-containing protein, partial [Chloroflexota bacterium]